MIFYDRFRAGVNLGGWLSQYFANLAGGNHFDSFITESDIAVIAGWGADHVRLPVDYDIIENESAPMTYDEANLERIDRCLEWCGKHGLNVILDLHKAPGQVYGYVPEPNPMLNEDGNRERFLAIWTMLAKRYQGIGNRLVFELVNEITDSTDYQWNRVYLSAVEAIRQTDAERVVLVGGNDANSVLTLKELTLSDDPLVVYNFHYYEPLFFTHQLAPFSEDILEYGKIVHYPGEMPEAQAYLNKHPEYLHKLGRQAWERNDKQLIEKYLRHADNFMTYAGKQLYCGEFGVIDQAQPDDAVRWVRDVVRLLDERGIGRAYWSYKEMDFGLVDRNGAVVNKELIRALFE
ncbi:glycoside hydrolase family 5 protein [Cohnella thailandensis]|uniref:Glycoside hydrolase family 5 protein n=1 Tax=Cohnella thailandensis TaxID=557557 RepID=A0A841SXY0_9BACL|nr:glycoside hydrolase family 5 protein [Cohnella thailandensis]MBB6633601.1 glycoside hydrolase family 5 protein [Cohnella thailandensis]MBP1974620.1 aryl-phospho-beta-D-glucosidase BglC (GH1 family) [Cohnella thailandensis]